jgi:putative transposon-encoded protein
MESSIPVVAFSSVSYAKVLFPIGPSASVDLPM